MTEAEAHDLAMSLRAQAHTLRREADALESTASWAEHAAGISPGPRLDNLSVPCPYCHAAAGERCRVVEPYADWSYAGRIYRTLIHGDRRVAVKDGWTRTLEGTT